jgi:CRISPR-associated protein Csx10
LLRVRLRTKEAVSLSRDQAATSQRRTLPYLTGSALRGALVELYKGSGRNPGGHDFAQLFLHDHVHYGNLYPIGREMTWADPVPLSAVTCKRYPGFYDEEFDPEHRERHGVRDILLQSLVAEPEVCGESRGENCCQAELTVQGGFCGWDSGAGFYRGVKLQQEIYARTAIEAEREIALSQNLYSLQTIAGGQEFVGVVSVPGRETEIVQRWLRKGATFRVGAAKTRGTGAVEVVEPPTKQDPDRRWGSLEERLKAFRKVTKEVLSQSNLQDRRISADKLFSLTLRSDTILLDRFLRHCPALSARALEEELKVPTGGFQMLRAFSDCRWLGGWNTAQQLPKETELAIYMGSSFLFSTTLDDGPLLNVLKQLEQDGLGERTQEGFGEVVINHPFHWKGGRL